MTLEELNEYGIIKADIERCREKIHELNVRTISSPIFDASGIAYSPLSNNPTEEKYINTMAEKVKYERQMAEDTEKITRIEKYISSIKDRRTRMIFEMHIYDSEPIWKIAMKFGGRNSESSVKNIFYRYLKIHMSGL